MTRIARRYIAVCRAAVEIRTAVFGTAAGSVVAIFTTLLLAPMSHAAVLQVSPVMVDFDPGAVATGVTLRNPGDVPLYGQVRVFRWKQSGGQDELEVTDELIVSPPLIEIPAKGQQLVRLVRRTMRPIEAEQSYRMLIDEVPMPGEPRTPGVILRLRYSVPVFIKPAAGEYRPGLDWLLWQHDREWYLSATNHGNTRAQISMVSISNANEIDDGATYLINKGLLGYALAGSTRQWRVRLPAGARLQAPLRIHATLNTVPGETILPIVPAAPSASAR